MKLLGKDFKACRFRIFLGVAYLLIFFLGLYSSELRGVVFTPRFFHFERVAADEPKKEVELTEEGFRVHMELSSRIEASVGSIKSWSVLIIGGLGYLIFLRRNDLYGSLLLLPILYFLIFAIYFSLSTEAALVKARGAEISPIASPLVNTTWWHAIVAFERGVVSGISLFLWNLAAFTAKSLGRRDVYDGV